jgi:hypothetical protein
MVRPARRAAVQTLCKKQNGRVRARRRRPRACRRSRAARGCPGLLHESLKTSRPNTHQLLVQAPAPALLAFGPTESPLSPPNNQPPKSTPQPREPSPYIGHGHGRGLGLLCGLGSHSFIPHTVPTVCCAEPLTDRPASRPAAAALLVSTQCKLVATQDVHRILKYQYAIPQPLCTLSCSKHAHQAARFERSAALLAFCHPSWRLGAPQGI